MEFVRWFSFIEALKTPLHVILTTYTENQLKLLALASYISYKNSQRQIEEESHHTKNKIIVKNEEKSSANIAVRKMTKDQLENYYKTQGF